MDPDNANLGLGLGLPGLKPGMADKAQVSWRGREGGPGVIGMVGDFAVMSKL